MTLETCATHIFHFNKMEKQHVALLLGKAYQRVKIALWTLNEKESFDTLDAFVAAGLNYIDTTDMLQEHL